MNPGQVVEEEVVWQEGMIISRLTGRILVKGDDQDLKHVLVNKKILWRILINIYLESNLDEALLAIRPDEMVVGEEAPGYVSAHRVQQAREQGQSMPESTQYL
jgi:hypothetical protein